MDLNACLGILNRIIAKRMVSTLVLTGVKILMNGATSVKIVSMALTLKFLLIPNTRTP